MNNIAIIEHKHDIEDALAFFRQDETRFVAVSAEASCALEKRAIAFVTDEDLLSPGEFKRIGEEGLRITASLVDKLDAALWSVDPIFEKKEFRPFRWNYYRIKILVDAVRARKALLDRLVDREEPVCLGFPRHNDARAIHDHHLFFHRDDSLYGLLACRIAGQKGIEVRQWSSRTVAADECCRHAPSPLIPGSVRKAMGSIAKLRKMPLARRVSENVLYGIFDHDIVDIVREMCGNANFYSYDNEAAVRFISSPLACSTEELAQPFPKADIEGLLRGISLTGDGIVDDVLRARLQAYAERYLPRLWRGLNYLEAADAHKDFKAYIHDAGASDAVCGLPLYYFQRRGKPVVIVQHGGYGYARNELTQYCEFGHDGYFFAWGDGVAEMYNADSASKCRIVATGSHEVDSILKNRKIKSRIKRVCYIPGSYRGYTAYFSGGQPGLDPKVFAMETRFLSALEPYKDMYEFTYKAAPHSARNSFIFGESPMQEWIEEKLPWMKIESRPLCSVIHDFDMFIIDFPTTILVQSIASGAEVAVYVGNPYYTMSTTALELLRRRAVVGLDESDFIAKIRSVLDSGNVVSDIADTSFLEKYGIHKNDGKALERMVGALKKLI